MKAPFLYYSKKVSEPLPFSLIPPSLTPTLLFPLPSFFVLNLPLLLPLLLLQGTGGPAPSTAEGMSESESNAVPCSIGQATLRDFAGLEEADSQVIHAMMEFSYNVLVGNMEDAFKSIKLIKR